jgi:hypothetical protein
MRATILYTVDMRRIAQLVALMVALLVAGQSAMAEAPCGLLAGNDHAAQCCTAAPATSSPNAGDCHGAIPGMYLAAGCGQGGCQMASVRPTAQALTTVKSRADRAAALVVIAQLPAVVAPAKPAYRFECAFAQRRARYLLFQVFRI